MTQHSVDNNSSVNSTAIYNASNNATSSDNAATDDTAENGKTDKTKASSASHQAGVFRRLAALFYDSVLALGIAFLITNLYLWVYHAIKGLEPEALDPRLLQTTLFPLIVAGVAVFFLWFWTHGGRTLGMRAWHLKITSTSGGPVEWPQALLRLITAPLSIVPFFMGYLWVWIDKESHSWHDRLSQTRVVMDASKH